MPDLLIHSMSEFSDLIIDSLAIAGAAEIVEIGAEFGGMSQVLADYAAYVACQERVSAAWQDADRWTRMSILNSARSVTFSIPGSDQKLIEKGRPGAGMSVGVVLDFPR